MKKIRLHLSTLIYLFLTSSAFLGANILVVMKITAPSDGSGTYTATGWGFPFLSWEKTKAGIQLDPVGLAINALVLMSVLLVEAVIAERTINAKTELINH